MPPRLLAKRLSRERAPTTLQAHLLATERAACLLFGPASRWGKSFLRFFKLPATEHERFLIHVRLAALFHDLGKANDDFLAAAEGRLREPQSVRHEHLSALVLHLPEVRRWLGGNQQIDWDVVTAAVLSHHFKAAEKGDWKWGQTHRRVSFPLFLGHPEVQAVLHQVAEVAKLPACPALPRAPWSEGPPWVTAWKQGLSAAHKLARGIRLGGERRALLLATKAGLIAADAAASALMREERPFTWLEDVVGAASFTADELEEKVLQPRIHQLEEKNKTPFIYHRFQEETARLGPRALLLAACGAGKTLAAWRWAQAQLRARPAGRVIFLYPTRGTATEGFRDYVAWAPEAEAALVSGTARYELEAMAANPAEPHAQKRFLDDADARLFALGYWPRRLFSATVDQFLGFMEHAYGSTCLLPVLADSVLVVDEIHSFDEHLFGVLVAFLQAFDLPVLCMTATLPPSRQQVLEKLGLEVFPRPEHRGALADLERQERWPRYVLEPVAGEEEALARALAAARDEGKRVLWVVNQVARCQRLARQVEAMLGRQVFCYHSRYKLDDRRRIHRETVDAFKPPAASELSGARTAGAFAVTTQVCEMSLDLDADVLVTETAPVTALVQRFGRANRHLRGKPEDFRARLLTYAPEQRAPYDREDLQAAEEFLKALGTRELSQRDLAEALERYARAEATPEGSARFLDAGYFATPGVLRDGEEWTRPCVLDDSDLKAAEALRRAGKSLDGLLVGVPLKFVRPEEERPGWLPKHLGVADARQYKTSLGFLMEKEVP